MEFICAYQLTIMSVNNQPQPLCILYMWRSYQQKNDFFFSEKNRSFWLAYLENCRMNRSSRNSQRKK